MDIHIYKMTNLIDGKAYIGQTVNLQSRISQHCCGGESEVSRAVHRVGRDNFKVEILETVHDTVTANKAEQHYIETYNTMIPNGYNKIHAPSCANNLYPTRGTGKPSAVCRIPQRIGKPCARVTINGRTMKLTEPELKKRYKVDFKDLRSFEGKEMSCFDSDKWVWNQIKLCEFCN